MSDIPSQTTAREKDRTLTAQAFNRLLVWLDEGSDSQGQKYLEMRARLVAYFDRKNCSNPDELADETLNRIARRLDEEGITASDTPARYCYIVARFVFMESLRGREKAHALITDLNTRGQQTRPTRIDDVDEQKQKSLSCLERCVEKLDSSQREIIARYYTGETREKINNRQALAQQLGISPNALSIRACRIRDKLEACVKRCLESD